MLVSEISQYLASGAKFSNVCVCVHVCETLKIFLPWRWAAGASIQQRSALWITSSRQNTTSLPSTWQKNEQQPNFSNMFCFSWTPVMSRSTQWETDVLTGAQVWGKHRQAESWGRTAACDCHHSCDGKSWTYNHSKLPNRFSRLAFPLLHCLQNEKKGLSSLQILMPLFTHITSKGLRARVNLASLCLPRISGSSPTNHSLS